LEHVIKPGGRLLLFSFTDDETSAPGGGVSQKELYEAFSGGWDIESVKFVRGELYPKFVAEFPNEYPNCGPKMFFAIIRRKE
jgi:hypothetical protein